MREGADSLCGRGLSGNLNVVALAIKVAINFFQSPLAGKISAIPGAPS